MPCVERGNRRREASVMATEPGLLAPTRSATHASLLSRRQQRQGPSFQRAFRRFQFLERLALDLRVVELKRLQGLQRNNSTTTKAVGPYEPRTFKEKWDLWMINEGGKRLFFAVWVFLHLLVAIFGVFNYGMKDNLNTARATFGVTFSAFSFLLVTITFSMTVTIRSNRAFCCPCPTCRCHLHPPSCLPQFYLPPSPHSSQPNHPF